MNQNPHNESHRGQRNGDRQHEGKDLRHRVELVVGIKVMVSDNIEPGLDITNFRFPLPLGRGS